MAGGIVPDDQDDGYSGSVLPFTRDAAGVHFDPHAGLLGQIINAVTLPGDVYSGKTPVNDASGNPTPAVMDRATNLASFLSPGAVTAEADNPVVLQPTRAAIRGVSPSDVNQNYRMIIGGRNQGVLSLNNEYPHDLYVNYVGNEGGPSSVGARNVRALLGQVAARYPDAQTISGYRESGARSGVASSDMARSAAARLPETPPQIATLPSGMNMGDLAPQVGMVAVRTKNNDGMTGYADGGSVLDLSSLKPLPIGGASPVSPASQADGSGGFDISSLRPYGAPEPDTSADTSAATSADTSAPQGGPPSLGHVLTQPAVGFNEALADTLGAPVDAMTWLMNKAGANIQQPVGGSESIKKGLGLIGANPEDMPAQNATEQVLRSAGSGVGMMVAPDALLGAAAKTGTLSKPVLEAAQKLFGSSSTAGDVAKTAAIGAGAGATGQVASDVTPEPYKPLASLAGNLVGGGLTAGAMSGAGSAARAAGHFLAPLTKPGQEAAAGTILAKNATDPDAAISAIANNDRELVPGSQPTTFQLTGDMGLGSLERSIATQNPAVFNALRASQNSARLDSLLDVQSEGHPEAVSDFFRNQLHDLDDQTQQAVDQATLNARGAASGLGGGKTPEAYGAEIQGAVEPQINAATEAARGAAEGLGAQGAEATAQQIRDTLQNRLADIKANESRLWQAVDPDNSLSVVTSPLKRATDSIYGEMGPEKAATLAPVEKQLAGIVGDYGPTLPFQRLTDLRSAVSSAMRQARSPLQPNEAAYGRLSQLRGAIEDAITDSVTGKVAEEQAAAQAGALSPEQGILSRWASDVSGAQQGVGRTVGRLAENPGPAGAGTESVLPAEIRAGSEGLGQPAGAPGNPQGPGNLVDTAAAERLNQASAATKERKATFGAEPVNKILQRPGATYPYTASADIVANHLWRPGAKGARNIRAILKAADNAPEAAEAIRSAAASSLKAKAENGIVTPKAFNAWRAQHGPALEALEEAAPGTTARFANAAKVAEGLDRFGTYAKTAPGNLADRYFAKGEDGFRSVNDLRELIGPDRADRLMSEYAADSLRKGAGTEAGIIDPKKFETWRKGHAGALRALPDLSAKLETAAKASDYLANVAERRRADLDAFQRGAVGKLLNVDDPADVTKTVGGMLGRNDSVKQMRDLAAKVSGDPAAREGLRKAIVDYMADKLISNTEAATSGRNLLKSDAFQSFLGKNYTALRQVFSDDEMGQMRAIAQDLKRANRSIAAVKLPGGSNTAQDFIGVQKHGGQSILHNLIEHLATEGAPTVIGAMLHGPIGAMIGYGGSHLFNKMRDAGLTRIDQLVRDAMLDPDLARSLLMKAPKRPGTGSELTLARQLRRLSVLAPISAATTH